MYTYVVCFTKTRNIVSLYLKITLKNFLATFFFFYCNPDIKRLKSISKHTFFQAFVSLDDSIPLKKGYLRLVLCSSLEVSYTVFTGNQEGG